MSPNKENAYLEMLVALRRAKFIMESPLIASWVNGAGALDVVRKAIEFGEAQAPVD